MKRIILLIIGTLFAFQMSVFAEIKTDVNEYGITIMSDYVISYSEGNQNSNLWITATAFRVFGALSSMEEREIGLYDTREAKGQPERIIVFSKKNPPKFEITKRDQVMIVNAGKIKAVGSENMRFTLKKNALKALGEAERVYLILPTKSKGEKKFEIPKEIIKEWEQVLNADLKQIRRNVLNG